MIERERHVATGLLLLLLILWGGFVIHRDPSFPGSLPGGVIGIGAALLMFVPLVYLIIKRVKFFKSRVVKRLPMKTLLAWHIYAGILGPILAIIHSAHRFESILGISMIFLMLLTVISGFTGRYLYGQIRAEIREKQQLLVGLRREYDSRAARFNVDGPGGIISAGQNMGFLGSLGFGLLTAGGWSSDKRNQGNGEILRIIDAIAALEYAIKAHEAFKIWFQRWLKFHILISTIFYVLIVIHISAEIYFGLRWL